MIGISEYLLSNQDNVISWVLRLQSERKVVVEWLGILPNLGKMIECKLPGIYSCPGKSGIWAMAQWKAVEVPKGHKFLMRLGYRLVISYIAIESGHGYIEFSQ